MQKDQYNLFLDNTFVKLNNNSYNTRKIERNDTKRIKDCYFIFREVVSKIEIYESSNEPILIKPSNEPNAYILLTSV